MPHPLEAYLETLRTARATGAATPELTYYTALTNLLNAVGRTLDPAVVFIAHPAGAADTRPDGGFYVASELVPDEDAETILTTRRPSHGVAEVKGVDEDADSILRTRQIRSYVSRYHQVLVTNYREFRLVIRGDDGRPEALEPFTLASDAAAFWRLSARPQRAARDLGDDLLAYLRRAMLHAVPITDPEEVAGHLAAYARQALRKVEESRLPALQGTRRSIEQALGVTFQGDRGEHLFRSTLVQTLWYGVFSAWVLWSREQAPDDRAARFEWRMASWSLRVPVIRALYEMVASPARLGPLRLVNLLDWTEDVLNRVDRRAFFRAFDEDHAVQYFYEPFLQAFDPVLRREMGVWYTPREVVKYQVARVDRVLREELGVVGGLASRNVYVLDPCCGTGAYLVETLRQIAAELEAQGVGATLGGRLKEAATERLLGFEIMPAPFVVAHLQLGLLLQAYGAPLAAGAAGEAGERAAVYLTNALTGWEPEEGPKQRLLFEELEDERSAAGRVKRDAPILVVLGNPPYYGFAGMPAKAERSLTDAYRTTHRAPPPQGQGLNDPYVRFWRMAEHRIVERTRQGVVCYITNYSWLDKSSFTGMRERFLEVFDRVWIDNMNGDSRATGKLTPDGQPDPSVFSTEENPEGIQVGTAVATLVRRADHTPSSAVLYRDLWGRTKRADLLASRDHDGVTPYERVEPVLALGLAFTPMLAAADYLHWPRIVDLFPRFYPGVQTKRDEVVIDIDRAALEERMRAYFDPAVPHERMAAISPDSMRSTQRFDAVVAREHLQRRGMLPDNLVRHVYRPFDLRWIYWEPETKLLGEKSPAYFPQVFAGNRWLVTQQRARRGWGPPQHVRSLGALHLVESSASFFPLRLRVPRPAAVQESLFGPDAARSHGTGQPVGRAAGVPASGDTVEEWNITEHAHGYLEGIGAAGEVLALFAHLFAVTHAPKYERDHKDALRHDWARVPLPATGDRLRLSAELGQRVMALLDPEQPVQGVTVAPLRPAARVVGILRTVSGRHADPAAGALAVSARWGVVQRSGAVMPGAGRVVARGYREDELAAFAADGLDQETVVAVLGPETRDLFLNEDVYWANVPVRVWDFEIGGYPVLRKWLSHRERAILGRDLSLDEVDELSGIVRRITMLLLLHRDLDQNYVAVAAEAVQWQVSVPSEAPVSAGAPTEAAAAGDTVVVAPRGRGVGAAARLAPAAKRPTATKKSGRQQRGKTQAGTKRASGAKARTKPKKKPRSS